MRARRPLEGLVVVALEQAVAAPFCSCRLADAGARIIKIERPEGDFARSYDAAVNGSQSSYFVWLNRDKESVALDIRTPEARAELENMIAGADILVQNLRPGTLTKLGFDIARLRQSYPKLICCSISGYGDEGALADRKAYDLLVQAESGLCSITGGPEAPSRVGISVVDIATGATAYAAVLEALIARGVSGEGCDIRLSMFDVIADWLTVPLLNAESGRPPKRMGLAHPSIAPYGVFTSSDGRSVLLAVQSEREWQTFCSEVLHMPDLPKDPRFESNLARVQNRKETDGLIAGVLGKLTRDEMVAQLTEADIAFGELNDMQALSEHPHLRRIEVETEAGPARLPAPAPLFDGKIRAGKIIPALGAQNEAVLGGARKG